MFAALIAAAGLATTVFSSFIFGVLGRLQKNVETLSHAANSRSAQLTALNEANLALSEELLTSSILQRVADLSRDLVQCRFAALSVMGANGEIETFHTSGMDEFFIRNSHEEAIGNGILGEIIRGAEPLPLDEMSNHADFTGFPNKQSRMKALLGVPIEHKGKVVGSLYLSEKNEGGPFTDEDVEIAQLFANQAAVAIQNASLYDQIQALAVETERSRISREMHDGLAQVLSFVNTKSQAVEAFIAKGDVDSAKEQVGELSQAARGVYQDVREGILALRTQLGSGRSLMQALEEYVAEFQEQSGRAVKVDWHTFPDETLLYPVQELHVLRIIQESLTNVRKHAEADHVSLVFAVKADQVEVEISDNGKGVDPARARGNGASFFGLQTMEERAGESGGTFDFTSEPERGSTVKVRIPVEAHLASNRTRRESSLASGGH